MKTQEQGSLRWHTELDEALREAKEASKPVLSLAMLGRLDERESCANSRFFRAMLYGCEPVARRMREDFVLHWRSVRPVPRVTVDFGDGQRLEQTLTGNSAHVVLASDGAPVDCLPGLFTPREFLAALAWSREEAWPAAGTQRLQAAHQRRLEDLFIAWSNELENAGQERLVRRAVARLKKTRRIVPALDVLEAGMSAALWRALGQRRASDPYVGEATMRRVRAEFPDAVQAGRQAISKLSIEVRMLMSMRGLLSSDTAHSEYALRRRVHQHFIHGAPEETSTLDALTTHVYRDIFQTPLDDPHLGLTSGWFSPRGDGELLRA